MDGLIVIWPYLFGPVFLAAIQGTEYGIIYRIMHLLIWSKIVHPIILLQH